MLDVLSVENLANLGVLLFLQAVLGFDNLLYISIESQRAPEGQRAKVRKAGILIAVALRIVLLFVMIKLIELLTEPFFAIHWEGLIEGAFNFSALVFIFGGVFIMYTAVKEISHLLAVDDVHTDVSKRSNKSALSVILLIVFMNLISKITDNLLYISIESQRAPEGQRAKVRKAGILIAVALRIVLLFVMIKLIELLTEPFFAIHWEGLIEGAFNFSALVFIFGGVFIMYTAVKEISHLLAVDDVHTDVSKRSNKSALSVILLIVFMNLIFSFDSILSALAITDVFIVLTVAIVISGLAMLMLADTVANFIQKNRKYEVLGLFILLIVGIVLLGEGGHVAHLTLFGYQVEPMAKSTFYFSIAVLVLVDVIQSGYQRKINLVRSRTEV